MKPTTIVKSLEKYFNRYLLNDRGSSPRTMDTYRYAFIQFVEYMESVQGVRPDKLEITDINCMNLQSFLLWLEEEKHVSVSTRNQRLAAFKSFASFLKYDRPEYIAEAIQIQSIVPKKDFQKDISYVTPEGMNLLLSQVNQHTVTGRRDFVMLSLLYGTGMRVSELIGLRGADITLGSPSSLLVHGKGGKVRRITIVKHIVPIIKKYIEEYKCFQPCNIDRPIFRNHSGEMFTRQGVNVMLLKYAKKAREIHPELIPSDLSPHKIRHSTAMALVENGTDLIIIRDILGHSSVQTTEIYAKVSTTRQRAAIEASSKELVAHEDALWETDNNIKDWLRSMYKPKIM